MIDRSDWTEDELLATVAVVGEWVEPHDLTIEYFMKYVDEANERGYTRWGTQSELSSDGSRSRIVFLRRNE